MAFSDIVGTSVTQFVDYALAIVSVMILYYIVKFFLVGPPTKEEKEKELEGRRKAFGEWREKSSEDSKKKAELKKKEKEKARKKNVVSPIKENLVNAVEAVDEAIGHLNMKKPDKVREVSKKLHRHLETAWANLKLLRRDLEGQEREFASDLIEQVLAVQKLLHDAVKDKLPHRVDATWAAAVGAIQTDLKTVRSACGALFKKVEQFHQ